MFFAHYIAEWLGIPAGIVIAALLILRRKGRALRARRQHARSSPTSATTGHHTDSAADGMDVTF